MRRGTAVAWHAVSFLVAVALYFVFVLPRWWELDSHFSHAVGTAGRILTAVVLALTALPVLFTLLKTRRPEFGTPELAVSLRTWSVIGHFCAAVLILATAIAEIWLNLDTVGRWLFAVYGAAAAIAVLSAAAFYLAYAAELPPPAPKPLKPKAEKAPVSEPTDEPTEDAAPEESEVAEDPEAEETPEPVKAGLRNRRPGKAD